MMRTLAIKRLGAIALWSLVLATPMDAHSKKPKLHIQRPELHIQRPKLYMKRPEMHMKRPKLHMKKA